MQTCKNCGSFVSTHFARVFGDNDDEVWACLSCTTGTDILAGGAVHGVDAATAE